MIDCQNHITGFKSRLITRRTGLNRFNLDSALNLNCGALAFVALAIVQRNAWWLLAALLCGYAFAWVGHFFFEKNRPATFRHPFYSFAGDWVMFKDILSGRIRF